MADLKNSNKRKSTHDSLQDKKKSKSDCSSKNPNSIQDCHAIIQNLITNIIQSKVAEELGAAVQSNDRTKVQHLIEKGADVNTQSNGGTSLLHWAVYKNYFEVVKILLKGGANIRARDIYDASPLFCAML